MTDQANAESKSAAAKVFPYVLGFTALALIAAIVFGVLWLTTSNSDEHETDVQRDQIVDAAKKGIVAFTQFDSAHLDQWRQGQRSVATAKLYADTGKNWQQTKTTTAATGLSTKVRVLDAGVYQLNIDDPKPNATVMVATNVTYSGKTIPTHDVRIRWLVPMVRQNGKWLTDSLEQVQGAGAQ